MENHKVNQPLQNMSHGMRGEAEMGRENISGFNKPKS